VTEPTTVSDRTHGASGARIAAELREAILAGRYAPGSRIRQEDIAEAHGASRVPVREALRILEAEGLVTLVANTGAWVAKLNAAECEELYRVRERLEPYLLSLNVPLLDERQIDELELAATAMEHTDDAERFLQLDREFHLASYAVAETTMLHELIVRLWNRTQPYRRVYTRMFRAEGDRSVHYEHHLLVAALRRRDSEGAERVLAGHIRRTRLELARHPEVFDLV
jgi:DNA-binding GntR family transcriptional regulator